MDTGLTQLTVLTINVVFVILTAGHVLAQLTINALHVEIKRLMEPNKFTIKIYTLLHVIQHAQMVNLSLLFSLTSVFLVIRNVCFVLLMLLTVRSATSGTISMKITTNAQANALLGSLTILS